MWTLLFKNIKSFVKNKPLLFFFIIISQIVCILSTFSVAGMIDSTTPQPEDNRANWEKTLYIYFHEQDPNGEADDDPMYFVAFDRKTGKMIDSGTDEKKARKYDDYDSFFLQESNLPIGYEDLPKYSDVKDKVNRVLSKYKKNIDSFYLAGYINKTYINRFMAISGSKDFYKSWDCENLIGEAKSINLYTVKDLDLLFSKHKKGDKIKLQNTEYNVSKVKNYGREDDFHNNCVLNIEDTDDNFIVDDIAIKLNENLSQEKINEINKNIMKEFGNIAPTITPPTPKPLLEKQFNNMIYVVSIIIILVVLLNISRLYTYILSKRKKSLAVFALCGGNKPQMFLMYLLEVFITLAGSFLIGFLIFHFGLLHLIAIMYPSFEAFFTAKIYLTVFGIYVGIGLLIMSINILPIVIKSVVDLKRR
ncbi:MAG: ABC transporter permease [Ruminococcus sp.]|nr:ABC transporter permease [Ruminococcus sp.]